MATWGMSQLHDVVLRIPLSALSCYTPILHLKTNDVNDMYENGQYYTPVGLPWLPRTLRARWALSVIVLRDPTRDHCPPSSRIPAVSL